MMIFLGSMVLDFATRSLFSSGESKSPEKVDSNSPKSHDHNHHHSEYQEKTYDEYSQYVD
jgi:hypothetical protein